MMPVLVAESLHKSYFLKNETIHVLKGITLEVDKGRFVVITGPSGCGKSTLLNILGSLDRPDQGKVVLDAVDILQPGNNRLRARIRNEKIGFIFQFHHLLPEFTALENVALPAMVAAGNHHAARLRAAVLLSRFGLGGLQDRFPDELSGGERQRVAICRALVNDPLVVLADEPTGNLDDDNKDKLVEVLLGLKDEGRTIILVTHSLDIAKIGTDVYNLKEGKLYAMR